jgi:hypothetical protein
MPKMLRPYFKYDHKLYPKFARCTYETLRDLLQAATGNSEAVPGMVIGIHTAGQKGRHRGLPLLANHHPHLHGIFTSGGFDKDGNFRLLPTGLDVKKFEELLRLRILKMMLDEGKITRLIAEKLMNWNHSGFGAYTGDAIPADDRDARERAARYLVRAPISLEKLQYIPEEGKVVIQRCPHPSLSPAFGQERESMAPARERRRSLTPWTSWLSLQAILPIGSNTALSITAIGRMPLAGLGGSMARHPSTSTRS